MAREPLKPNEVRLFYRICSALFAYALWYILIVLVKEEPSSVKDYMNLSLSIFWAIGFTFVALNGYMPKPLFKIVAMINGRVYKDNDLK